MQERMAPGGNQNRMNESEEYPYLSEESYERKRRRHRQNGWSVPLVENAPARAKVELALLNQAEWEHVISHAGLTTVQAYVLIEYGFGKTIAEIAQERGTSKQAVWRSLKSAIAKVKFALESDPYAELAEVYEREVNR